MSSVRDFVHDHDLGLEYHVAEITYSLNLGHLLTLLTNIYIHKNSINELAEYLSWLLYYGIIFFRCSTEIKMHLKVMLSKKLPLILKCIKSNPIFIIVTDQNNSDVYN